MIKRFEVGGISYGPQETAELRREIIRLRDSELKENDMDSAVLLTHTIGILHELGKFMWGNKFTSNPEDTGSVR